MITIHAYKFLGHQHRYITPLPTTSLNVYSVRDLSACLASNFCSVGLNLHLFYPSLSCLSPFIGVPMETKAREEEKRGLEDLGVVDLGIREFEVSEVAVCRDGGLSGT